MKKNIILIVLVIIVSCNSTEKNAKLLRGSWEVRSLSKYPLIISGYDKGKLEMHSRMNFDNKGNLKILLSDSIGSIEVFKYRIENNNVIIYYSDYGIPFSIKDLGDNKVELASTGYGNTEQARKEVRKIILNRKE